MHFYDLPRSRKSSSPLRVTIVRLHAMQLHFFLRIELAASFGRIEINERLKFDRKRDASNGVRKKKINENFKLNGKFQLKTLIVMRCEAR